MGGMTNPRIHRAGLFAVSGMGGWTHRQVIL
jgi:hypothetical protein